MSRSVSLLSQRWLTLLLSAALLLSGTPRMVSEVAAARARLAAVVTERLTGHEHHPRSGVPPALIEPHALDAPTASGANPVYPLNHTFDADPQPQGTPPTNSGFESSPIGVGTPPTNHDLEAAPSDVGTPATNHDFETGDFTGWTTTGSVSLQSDATHGFWAKLAGTATLTSSAFTVDSGAQALLYDLNFISTTGLAGAEIYVLSGAGYTTSTRIDQVSCSACGTWVNRYADLSGFLGQSVKLQIKRYLGDVGVDRIRPATVFSGMTLTGNGMRLTEVDGNDADRLDSGTLTTPAFTVDGTAQFASVRIKGMTGGTDQYYLYVLSGAGYTTQTTVVTGTNAVDSWTTIRFNVVGWRGQSIKLKVARQFGAIAADDLAVQAIELPGWDLNAGKDAATLPGGPDGNYLSITAGPSLNATLTSSAITLPGDAQQLTLLYKGGTAGAQFYVELLHGTNFATVVDLAGLMTPNTTEWKTLKVGVGAYAGESVKLRIRQYSGTGLYDNAGLGELTVPGWTVTGTAGVTTGSDTNGTWVTAVDNAANALLRSVDLSTGIITLAGTSVRMYHAVAYDIGYATGSLLRVTWYNPSTGQSWVVFQDASDTPTGYRVRYFPIYDFMGPDGYFVVQVPRSGKLYSLDDNIARQQLSEPFTERVGLQVNTSTGGFGYAETDLAGTGTLALVLTRYYNGHSDRLGSLGYRWSHSFDTRLYVTDEGDAGVIFGSGREEFFDWLPTSQSFVVTDLRVHDALVKNADGSYTFTTTTNLAYYFTASGQLTSIVDLNGNTVSLAYDGAGKLTTVTDPVGRTLSFSYDGAGRLTSVTDAIGAVITYGYDADGDLATVTDPEGGVRQYTYSKHRLVGVLDPNGQTLVATTLDQFNRVTSQTDAGGETISLSYSTPAKGVTTVTDPTGNAARFYFDRFARTTDMVDPLNHVITRIYDAVGNLQRVIDPADNTWQFAYTSAADPSAVTDPLGNPMSYTWNAQHLPTTITDARGETTTISYDAGGNPLTITDPLNQVTTFTYDAGGHVLSVTDPLGHTWASTYDAQGNQTSQTDPLGHTWTYTYDANGRLATATDPRGATTTYYHDLLGRLIGIVDPLDGLTAYLYDPAGHLLSVTDPLGHERQWDYDARGLVEATIDPAGKRTTYTYDANRNITAVTDPLGFVTVYAYDDRNRLVTVTNPSGGQTSYAYDDAGHLASKTDALGRSASYAYDAAGRLTSQVLSNGGVCTYTYDANGNLLSETDPLNHTTSYAYDALNRLTSATDPLGHATTYTYDAAGRLTSVVDALGGVTAYTYDAVGRMTAETDPLNHTTSYGYDAVGNQTSVTDPLNRTATTVFDALNRVTAIVDPLGNTLGMTYDAAGRRTRTSMPSGSESSFAYDSRGLLTSETDPLGNVTTYAYDDLGRRTATTDPLGHVTTYAYDAAQRAATVTDALGGQLRFVYDAAGQLSSFTNARGKTTRHTWNDIGLPLTITDPLGHTTSYTYDLAGRVTGISDPRGTSASYAYDAANNPTLISYPGGTTAYTTDALGRRTAMTDALGTTTWTYDAGSRVTSAATPQGTVAYTWDAAGQRTSMTIPGNRSVTYAYDAAGRLTGLTDWQSQTIGFAYDVDGRRTGITRPNGVTTTLGYDAAGQVTSIVHGTGLGNLLSFSATYDAAGNRTSVTSGAGVESYTVDALNRLTGVSYPNGDTAAWTYDANGNRLTETVNGVPTATSTYDDADRLLSDGSTSFTYDAAGNLLAAGADSYSWDWAGELTGATVNGVSSSYAYDGDGLRVSQTSGGVATTYLWDRLSGLPALLDDGSTAYLPADGVQAAIAPNGVTSYPLADALGSIRGLSDASGALIGTADYSAFGTVRAQSGATSRFGFSGEQTDPASGLVYLRARYLDPGHGRLLAADSVQPNAPGPSGYNAYAYVANNPTTWTDPSGHQAAAPSRPGGSTEYAAILALALAAAAALASLGEKIAAVLWEVVCYLTPACWLIRSGAVGKIKDLGSGAAGEIGSLPGEVPSIDIPTVRFDPSKWRRIGPSRGGSTDPDPEGGAGPWIDLTPICLVGLCHDQGSGPETGTSTQPANGSPSTAPTPPARVDPGTGVDPVRPTGPQPQPQPVAPPPDTGTPTPTPPQNDCRAAAATWNPSANQQHILSRHGPNAARNQIPQNSIFYYDWQRIVLLMWTTVAAGTPIQEGQRCRFEYDFAPTVVGEDWNAPPKPLSKVRVILQRITGSRFRRGDVVTSYPIP